MKRLLPAPLISLALWVLWMVLNRSLDAGQALLGVVLALAIPLLTRGLRPLPVRWIGHHPHCPSRPWAPHP